LIAVLQYIFKFSIDSCIAILFYFIYIAIQMAILFWKSANFSNLSSKNFEMMLLLRMAKWYEFTRWTAWNQHGWTYTL